MQQQEPNGLSPAQRELEEALRTLAPSAARVDAVAAAFTAGRNSAHRQIRTWQAAAILLLAVGTSAWLLPHRPGGPILPRNTTDSSVLVVRSQPSPASAPAPAPQSLLMLQRTLVQEGVDGLPATQLPAADASQPKDTL
jgi:hypothetical protein